MKRRVISIISILCILISLLNFNLIGVNASASGNEKGRLINVVYDDSGSMVKDGGDYITRWSQAKYAVEVFTAMMGQTDTINIYPMSKEGEIGLTLQGSDEDRVSKIHNMNARYANTPFTTVTSAAQDLIADDSEKEKWLVIITDGAFDDGATSTETVYEKIDEYTSQGIKVVYLAIGENATVLNGDASKSFYAEKASDGSDVLDKVMKIANQIFTHMILPDNRITSSGNITQLDIDIPVNKIMIFAQGDNVSIGEVRFNGITIMADEIENVKYSDVIPDNYKDAIVDTSLKGVIATYEADGQPFESGKYEVEVTGAQNIQFYYSPGVEVNCNLLLEGNAVSQEADLYAGNYEVEMNFINPITGETVKSDLLSDATFSLSVENNGNTQNIDGTKGEVQLVEGEVVLDAIAYLPDEVTLKSTKIFEVLPEAKILSLKFTDIKDSYTADEVAEGMSEIILTVTDSETGHTLSQEEWDNTNIKIEELAGVSWSVEKGEDVSTWNLIPKSSDGSIASVQTGDFSYLVSAEYSIDNQYAYGSGEMHIAISGYEGDLLTFEVENLPDTYTLDNLENEGVIVVKAYIENKETNEKEVINENLWNDLKFENVTKDKIDLNVAKGTEVGTYIIRLGYYKEDPLKTTDGNVSLMISAEGQDGEHIYKGNIETIINIKQLSKTKWLVLMAPKLIAIAIILFIIIGYLKKNRIKTKGLNPHNVYKAKVSGKRKIKKKLWSVIIPYVDEKAIVQCRNTGYECYFPNLLIRATSKNSFRIKNANIDLKTILINGAKITEMKDLTKQNFNYSGFQITSIDTKNNNKKLGSFVFR